MADEASLLPPEKTSPSEDNRLVLKAWVAPKVIVSTLLSRETAAGDGSHTDGGGTNGGTGVS